MYFDITLNTAGLQTQSYTASRRAHPYLLQVWPANTCTTGNPTAPRAPLPHRARHASEEHDHFWPPRGHAALVSLDGQLSDSMRRCWDGDEDDSGLPPASMCWPGGAHGSRAAWTGTTAAPSEGFAAAQVLMW